VVVAAMKAQATALQQRLRAFFVRVCAFCEGLPRSYTTARIAPQLIDAAGGAASNYNGACRARSRREFAAKIGVAAEEASEALEWLHSLRDAGVGRADECEALIQEADELTAILTASHRTSSRRK
jgi:four helix bundle protein